MDKQAPKEALLKNTLSILYNFPVIYKNDETFWCFVYLVYSLTLFYLVFRYIRRCAFGITRVLSKRCPNTYRMTFFFVWNDFCLLLWIISFVFFVLSKMLISESSNFHIISLMLPNIVYAPAMVLTDVYLVLISFYSIFKMLICYKASAEVFVWRLMRGSQFWMMLKLSVTILWVGYDLVIRGEIGELLISCSLCLKFSTTIFLFISLLFLIPKFFLASMKLKNASVLEKILAIVISFLDYFEVDQYLLMTTFLFVDPIMIGTIAQVSEILFYRPRKQKINSMEMMFDIRKSSE
ncbi:Protein CBG27347 [Caenorhabditis briggsae]|uniref:Protein CBG27347 n=1 Tax=Caenorhabditis briggsae TaxID=6238 RepID=B6IGE8_CAEBR|nr:Protein CBG27347 [Caenorhabditis briggsae]CAR98978.1 Protein CBG27347 [Caenorhabditis briggsae]